MGSSMYLLAFALLGAFADGHRLPPSQKPSRVGSSAFVTMRGGDATKVIIAGAPASGKGTQCELIKNEFGLVHLSTGDMLRAAVAEGTEVGNKAKSFMDSGKLVPDDVIIGVVKDRLAQSDCQEKGWLLDGFPRTAVQAEALSAAKIVPDLVIYLNVPDDMLIERVVGRRLDPETGRIYHLKFDPPPKEIADRVTQRSDDTAEKAKVRLGQFHEHLGAILDAYKDVTVEIDGTKSKKDVFAKIGEAFK